MIASVFAKYRFTLLCALFLTLCFLAFRSYTRAKKNIALINASLKTKADSLLYYEGEISTLRFQILGDAVIKNEQKIIIDSIKCFYKPLIDSLKSRIHITSGSSFIEPYYFFDNHLYIDSAILQAAYSNDQNLLFTDSSLSNHFYIDSVKDTSYRVHYLDKWMKFSGDYHPGKTFHPSYKLTDSLMLTSYSKRTGFLGLGGRKYYIDIHSFNPNESLKGVYLAPKPDSKKVIISYH
jgi:hypothetical protein